MPDTTDIVDREQFLAQLAGARSAALLLDYDGTLAPFNVERDRAMPYPGVAQLLQEIMREGSTRVVMVTGRPAGEVVRLLGVYPYPEVWGAYGLQRLRTDGSFEMTVVDSEAQQGLTAASAWLKQLGLRDRAEVKPGSVALHWRGLPEAESAELKSKVLLLWMPLAFRFNLGLLEFDGGLELRVTDRNKTDAVHTIRAEMGKEAVIAYLGDDQTDEEAFSALGPGGFGVLVRPEWRSTAAHLWIRPPAELLDFLSQWLRARRRGR
ncbi:MAG TPA: trehalose-phosphatase [Terriglobales bacterium]|nr:trehalose-phosphatase [Terriglobales bacterium]